MQIHFLISAISDLGGIPLSEYDEAGNIKYIYCSLSDRKEVHPFIAEHIRTVIGKLDGEDFAIEYLSGLPICICGTKLGESYFIWGPVAFRRLKEPEKKKYTQKMGGQNGAQADLYYCGLKRLFSAVALVIYTVTGKEYDFNYFFRFIEETQVFPSYDSQRIEYIIKREDCLLLNHSYTEEQVIMDKIRTGDVDGIKHMMKIQNYKYPLILEENVLKNEEYMAIAFITLAARAAIEGGATSGECFAISDIYLRRIAMCHRIGDIKRNVDEGTVVFTELVRKYLDNKSSNTITEDCKKYIAQNLFKKISLSHIAKALQMNASYLSKIFSESEGMTVSQYIQAEKIEAAKNMLIYSDRSVYEISEYLHMSTHSYFSGLFKKKTGMTPKEFRIKNHPPEF